MKISHLEQLGLVSLVLTGCAASSLDKEVDGTCEAVHGVVLALYSNPYFPTEKNTQEAREKADKEKTDCEKLDPDAQEKLLMSYTMALSVSRTRF